MYVFGHICMFKCLSACMSYACMYSGIYVCLNVCLHVCVVHVCVKAYMYVYMSVCMHVKADKNSVFCEKSHVL